MFVLTDRILALLGKLGAMLTVEVVAARRMNLRLDLRLEPLSLMVLLLSLPTPPRSLANSRRTIAVREGWLAGGVNHLSGNS
jgi:hypothetical protein